MLEHFKGDEELVSKIQDYGLQAERGKLILTKFLNPHERKIVHDVLGHQFAIYEEGGLDGAENKRVIICQDYYDITPEDFKIKVFVIDYNDHFGKLRHRDVLGALMHLGIDRSVIGDICEKPLAMSVCEENSAYIQMNLNKIKRSHIHLRENMGRLSVQIDYTTKRFYLSSLRLDKVVASFFKLSRTKAQEAILRGDVKVNYKVNMNIAYLLVDGDMISLRHYGRVKLSDTKNITRNENHIVDALYYK